MTTIVGLFESDKNVQSTIQALKDAGFAEDEVRIFTEYETVQRLFGNREARQVIRYVIAGAVIGITLMLLYGLILGGYACTVMFGFIPVSVLGCNTVGAIVIGLILGGFAGWFFGVYKFEKNADQYTHGVGQGDKLITLNVTEELAPKAMKILQHEKATGIKTFDDLQGELKKPIWQREW